MSSGCSCAGFHWQQRESGLTMVSEASPANPSGHVPLLLTGPGRARGACCVLLALVRIARMSGNVGVPSPPDRRISLPAWSGCWTTSSSGNFGEAAGTQSLQKLDTGS